MTFLSCLCGSEHIEINTKDGGTVSKLPVRQ